MRKYRRFISLIFLVWVLVTGSAIAGQEFDDGVNEPISLGSDASIDDLNPFTIACWVEIDDFSNDQRTLWEKVSGTAELGRFQTDGTLQLFHGFSTDFGQWRTVGSLTTGTPHHVVVSYDNSDTANVPTVYFDLVSQTVNTEQTPVGTASSDAASNLLLGGRAAGTDEMDGALQHCVIDDTIWSAAQRNRHYYYGTIGGGVEVQHPMVTDKLENEGSATANLDNSNGIRPIPRVERRWGSMMGVGEVISQNRFWLLFVDFTFLLWPWGI